MEEKNKTFSYTYTAPSEEEKREIEEIRSNYVSDEDRKSKIERMRELNAKVYRIPKLVEALVCVVGILVFGLGLTMILEWSLILWGSLVCLLACVVLGFTHFFYKLLLKRNKNLYREEILKLSDELLNGDREGRE